MIETRGQESAIQFQENASECETYRAYEQSLTLISIKVSSNVDQYFSVIGQY